MICGLAAIVIRSAELNRKKEKQCAIMYLYMWNMSAPLS